MYMDLSPPKEVFEARRKCRKVLEMVLKKCKIPYMYSLKDEDTILLFATVSDLERYMERICTELEDTMPELEREGIYLSECYITRSGDRGIIVFLYPPATIEYMLKPLERKEQGEKIERLGREKG